ncbi:hypothetical protein EIP86_007877 [Pleurotus ostreatoroseus]|nr:hypothetical protein EIP86_007877 [Pleurotus ostreatoroseus]
MSDPAPAADGVAAPTKAVLLAHLDDIACAPHFLAAPIRTAAGLTAQQLRIVLVSPCFDTDAPLGTAARGTARWDEVQATLTYVYVQATKVAQEMGKILMDVDVLLQGEREPLPEAVAADVRTLYRVSNTDVDPATDHLVPPGCATVWLAPSDDPATLAHTPSRIPRRPSDAALPAHFPVVALGGTFDHLHAGHKILLSMAAWIARDTLIVGVTDDALLQKKANKDVLQSIGVRMTVAKAFLRLFRPQVQYEMVPITDVYGPTGWEPNIQALVVSKETLPGAEAIEKHRKEKSLPPLHRFVIDVISHSDTNVDAEDAEAMRRTKMSSTFIREWIVQQRNKS